jgi:hypothetical protein
VGHKIEIKPQPPLNTLLANCYLIGKLVATKKYLLSRSYYNNVPEW